LNSKKISFLFPKSVKLPSDTISTHPGHPGSDAEAAADLSSKTHIPAILGMMLKRPQIYQAKQAPPHRHDMNKY